MNRWRGAASGWLSAVLLLLGLPVGLIRFVGWPLPHHWPTRDQWTLWLQNPIADRHTLVDLFAIALWIVWAVLLYAVLTDAAGQVRRAARRLWRLARRTRPLSARNLLSAAVVGTGTAAASVVATAHPPTAATPHAPDTPAPPASPGPTAPVEDHTTTPADRVVLPDGGWMTRHTAAAVAASGAMVWRERRRQYRPRLFVSEARDDPDLAPLPPTAAAIIQQLQPPPEQPPTPTDPTDDVSTHTALPSSGPAVMVGESVGQPLPLSALPPGGVGLAGQGATDAARGILIAALLSAAGPAAAPTVVVTASGLATLLGTVTRPDPVPGLRIAENLTEAIAELEDMAMARADQGTNHADAHDASHTVLLALAPTDPQYVRRLRVLLTLAADKAITGVLLGDWRPGPTWQVQRDGTLDIATGLPTRLSVLGTAATGDLLAVYREAHARLPASPADGDLHGEVVSAVRVPRQMPAYRGSPPAATAPHPDRILLTVLGPPAVYRPGEVEPVRWPRTAAMPVLVYLAVNPAGATSTDLATVLWPQEHPGSTINRVYNIISTVHRTLDTAAGGPTVTRAGDRYRLNPNHVEVDLWRLQEAIRAASRPIQPIQRAAALRRLIDAYIGELADGWPWPWLDPYREATRRQVLDAHATLADSEPEVAAARPVDAEQLNPENDEPR